MAPRNPGLSRASRPGPEIQRATRIYVPPALSVPNPTYAIGFFSYLQEDPALRLGIDGPLATRLRTCSPPWSSSAKLALLPISSTSVPGLYQPTVHVSLAQTPLWTSPESISRMSTADLERYATYFASEVSGPGSTNPDNTRRLPSSLASKHGELSYRVLQRCWDLSLAFKTVPVIPESRGHFKRGFTRVVRDMILRSFYIRIFKWQLQLALYQWGLDIDKFAQLQQTGRAHEFVTLMAQYNFVDGLARKRAEMHIVSALAKFKYYIDIRRTEAVTDRKEIDSSLRSLRGFLQVELDLYRDNKAMRWFHDTENSPAVIDCELYMRSLVKKVLEDVVREVEEVFPDLVACKLEELDDNKVVLDA